MGFSVTDPALVMLFRSGPTESCVDDESFRRRSNVIERVTRHERQSGSANVMKNNAFIGRHYSGGLHDIFVPAL
jgi:hypothetical protein